MISSLKLENPKLNRVYSKVLPIVNYTLWSNFKGLAASKKNGRKIKGYIKAVIIKREVKCQRDDFLHKLSRMYVNNFDIICVEDLDVIGPKEKGHN